MRRGIVVVLDDEDRENEADLIMAAEHVTTEMLAFFLTHTSGFLCAALAPDRADDLDLPPMVAANTEALTTAFTVSVDVRSGTTTGISASDRAATCRALADGVDLSRDGAEAAADRHAAPAKYADVADAYGLPIRYGHARFTDEQILAVDGQP